jgi:hypothetical protein
LSSGITDSKGKKPDLDEATLQIAKRILSTPPKPHSAMKIGKRKAKASTKERPASKGRIHKGSTRG